MSQWIIRLTKHFLEETQNEEMSLWFASCFAEKKNIFTSGFPVKKPTQKKISSQGHELTSAHCNLLVIPTWFLLFSSLSLLILWKISSMWLYQATKAVGKSLTFPSDTVPLYFLRPKHSTETHQHSHRRSSVTTLQAKLWRTNIQLQTRPQTCPTSQPLQRSLCRKAAHRSAFI